MALAIERDLTTLTDGTRRWLSDRLTAPDVEIVRCERPSEGLSSETLLVEAAVPDQRDRTWEGVLRLPPSGTGIFPAYDLQTQRDAQEAAAAHGIPVAVPVEFVHDERWLGAPFLVMPLVPGRIPGSMPLHDPWIGALDEADRHRLYDGVVDLLAAVHRIDPDAAPSTVPVRDLDAELGYWRDYLDWYADGEHPVAALDDALSWCVTHRPPTDPPASLLWGDVRLGNVIFDDACTPVALLDWEMATVGAPEHDVAWMRTLEAAQDELFGHRVAGFPTLDDALARYEGALGRSLQALPWFEVFATVRSMAIMTRVALVHERAGRPPLFPIADNPMLDLLSARIRDAG